MRHHFIQTSYAFLAISAVSAALYFGVGDTFAAEMLSQPPAPEHVYTGVTPQLPEAGDRSAFSILTTPTGAMLSENSMNRTPYFVTSVIDGNTLIADGKVRIRLVGIRAPEKDEELGIEATDFLKSLVENKEIVFEPDSRNPQDTFGRLRGVVYVRDTNINTMMLENGYAQLFPVFPTSIDTDTWTEYVVSARQEKRGLWGDVTKDTPESPDVPSDAQATSQEVKSRTWEAVVHKEQP